MITVTIWHNVARDDGEGRHIAMLDGYRPGDPMVRVFAYQADPAGGPEAVAEDAFGIFNGHPRCASDAGLASAYYQRELRSLSVGDVVAAGDLLLAVGRPAGWEPVSGSVNEVRTCEHGTRPLPVSAEPGEPVPGSPAKEYRDDCP